MNAFCDFLGVTVPAEDWEALRLDIVHDLDAIGMGVAVDDGQSVLWRDASSTGTVKAQRRGRVWALGCSGAACAGLRVVGRFNSFLAAIGTRPHRVTRIDATVDVQEDAAPVVAEITRAGRAGELSLTRKAVQGRDVLSYTGLRADGAVSGSVYVGPRRADVRMVVYDKQHERLSRRLPDCGPLTRYELRLRTRTGITLRDASDPTAVFWHYAGDHFLPRPSHVPDWNPHGSGYTLERVAPLLPYQRLKRRVEASVDLASLIALAESCGPRGVDFLVSCIRGMARGAGDAPADNAVASSGPLGGADAADATHASRVA
jgi:hypothetical protein